MAVPCYLHMVTLNLGVAMSKKRTDTKHEKEAVLSKDAIMMKALYVMGNFFRSRKLAKGIISSSSSASADKALARDVLKMTWPDPVSLLAGAGSLAFTLVVAFFAAY